MTENKDLTIYHTPNVAIDAFVQCSFSTLTSPFILIHILESCVQFCVGNPLNIKIFELHELFWAQFHQLLTTNWHNDVIIKTALQLVRFLCRFGQDRNTENISNITKLRTLNISQHIVTALELHPSSIELVQEALGAVRNLASDDFHNFAFSQLRTCEIISILLKQHITDKIILERASGAIVNLANLDVNQEALGKWGAIELIAQGLEMYIDCFSVVDECCFAIGILAYQNDAHKLLLFSIGICDLVIRALRRHDYKVPQGCFVIYNLSAHEECRDYLGQSGACEIVVQSMKTNKDKLHIIEEGKLLFNALFTNP